NADKITLAVDNDAGGRNFITSLQAKGVDLTVDIPDLPDGQEKADWNSYLQQKKQPTIESEVNTFMEPSSAEKEAVGELKSYGTFIIDDDFLERRYGSVEHDNSITTPTEQPSSQVEEDFVADSKQEELTSKSVSYEDYKQETEALEKSLKQKISSGELSVNVDDEVYAYMIFNGLGNSHPMQTLTEKRLDTLYSTDILEQLKAVTDENVDAYKTKGTPEQDRLYQSLKANQRQLGLADVSSRFVGEMAISAYNANYRLSGLSQEEHFRNAESLFAGMVKNVIEYPCIENGNDIPVFWIHSDNALYRYLDQLSGDITLTREDLDKLIDTISYHSPEIVWEDNKKSLEETQEVVSSDSEQNKNERTNGSQGSLQPLAEGSPTPVPETGTFERSVTSRPTTSSHLLYFSINEGFKSINDGRYHSITQNDLVKLNRKIRRQTIQNAAQYYLEELANSKFYYVTSEKIVQVNFEEKHFMHLTGIKPKGEGQSAVKTLHDFAEGNGRFDNILLANNDAAFDKINVLSDLSVATESSSFYFDDLTDIQRYSGKFDSLLKSDDKDIILLFKEFGEESYIPVSIFQSRVKIAKELETVNKTPILGVYRERDGHLEQLSINEEYIKDDGEEMLSILQNKQYQEMSSEQALVPAQPEVTAEDFTKVLDAVYNNGAQIGKANRANIPEELHPSWDKYDEYAKQYDNDFKQILDAAEKDRLLDKSSDFYKAWMQDDIYDNHYHVRLQELSDETPLPFDVTEFIDYQTFATELYQRHQESQLGDEVTNATVNFAIYAPGGDLIKEEVSYHIGEENKPISQLLGLGYRRLKGYQELAQLDDEALSQLENQTVNQTIAKEANEPVSIEEEHPTKAVSKDEEPEVLSEKQVLKNQFAKRVEEILNNSPAQGQEPSQTIDMTNHAMETSTANKEKVPAPIDYEKITPHELSQVALQKIRDYAQSPKDLREYLDFMSRFPHLSPRNVALIQAQWPGANAVATYNQWQSMGDSLGISEDDVVQTKATYINKRTGKKKEVVHQGLSVKAGEKSQITLFRPQMEKMIPVLDSNGNQVKNEKGNPKFKRLSQATPQEKALVKDKKLKVTLFQTRDTSGQPLYTTYKVFELSQTTLKPESYPKAMPNRHYNFDTNQVKTYEVLEGLCDYAKSLGVTILQDDAHVLGNSKGAFDPNRQEILLNPHNTPGEKIGTTIHELAHATLHNPKLTTSQTKTVPRYQAELEAEMTSYLVSKHFGLDTVDKAFRYMANWTDNLNVFSDKALTDSMTRIHKTVMSMVNHVEQHTKPYQRSRGQDPNFPKAQDKGLSR
ncbi:MAG: PBECR4 domain-containing protein, partial [Streptococcus sp.]|nr:PBECR4 domain-containing protein [Streptococcus sp.]